MGRMPENRCISYHFREIYEYDLMVIERVPYLSSLSFLRLDVMALPILGLDGAADYCLIFDWWNTSRASSIFIFLSTTFLYHIIVSSNNDS